MFQTKSYSGGKTSVFQCYSVSQIGLFESYVKGQAVSSFSNDRDGAKGGKAWRASDRYAVLYKLF